MLEFIIILICTLFQREVAPNQRISHTSQHAPSEEEVISVQYIYPKQPIENTYKTRYSLQHKERARYREWIKNCQHYTQIKEKL